MSKSEIDVKPTFVQSQFRFENPLLIPDHYEDWPIVPNFVGLWAIYCWSGGEGTPKLALDVLSADQAELLATAARDKALEDSEIYGYTDDIWILDPSGNRTRFYIGRMGKRH